MPPSTARAPGHRDDGLETAFVRLLGEHHEPHCLIGVDGRILAINASALRLIAEESQTAMGRPFDSWVPFENRALLHEHLDRALAGELQRFRMPHTATSGHWLDLEITYMPLSDSRGMRAVLCATTDLPSAQNRDQGRTEGAMLLAIAGRLARFGGWALRAGSSELTLSPEARRILDVEDDVPALLEESIRVHAEHEGERIRAALEALFTRADPFEIEITAQTATGRPLVVRVLGEPVLDDQGRVVSARGAIWDVTESAAERARRAAVEQRLDETLNAFGDGLVFLDGDGRIGYVNTRAAQMVGRAAVELLGISIWSVFPEAIGSSFDRAFQRSIEEGVRTSVRVRSDRMGIWLDCTLHPTPGGLVLYARDATEEERMRRRADAAQQRIAEQAALLDASRDAVVVRSLDGVVQYWNTAAAQLYGWTAEEAQGRRIDELVVARPGEYEAAMTATLRDGYWSEELNETTRDGRAIIVDSRWQLLRDADGAPRGVFTLGSDVTRWRQDEEARLRARRLESLGTLAGGISHDLNNVLTPILMAVQLLGQGEQDPARRELLTTMETAARRGADMISKVLAFARGVDGRRERIAVDTLLDELRIVARDLLPSDVELTVEVEPIPPSSAPIGDSTQLLQVLTNLVTNARDAMPGGGALRVQASTVDGAPGEEPGSPPLGASVVIAVEDTGTGMPAEVAEKVFEPFFTTKPLGSGTGLGLATSLSIMRSHGGLIRVDSAPGRGTRVELLLPVPEAGAVDYPERTDAEQPQLPGAGELVLVIDDDASIRTTVAHALSTSGYRVLTAADGAAGIALVESAEHAVDAVLTDMMMPVMDGAETSAYLEEHHPRIPIIASSGLATHIDRDEAPGMGISAFLAKPYTTTTLLRTLRRVLDEAADARATPSASRSEADGQPG